MVEPLGQIAGDLDVLHLIEPDRHHIAVVDQDVGGHQDGIGEQAGIGGESLGDLVLVGVTLLQQAHLRDRHQQPRQLGDFGHVRLAEQRRPLRIESQSQQVNRRILRKPAQRLRIANGRQGVQIGDEVERLIVVLQVDVLLDRTEVIAPVESTCGLDTGENTHGRWIGRMKS